MINYLYSLLLHVSLTAVVVVVVSRGDEKIKRKPPVIKFKVIEAPVTKKAKPKIVPPPPPVKKPAKLPPPKIAKQKKQKIKKKSNKKARKVFGVSKKSLTSKRSNAPVVKRGNTIATAVDQRKLRADDAEELPIPTAEYLVTEMPTVISAAEIIYPKGMQLEGTVVLSVLIDVQGRVRAARIITALAPAMDAEALRAIKKYRFSPAKIEATPVAVRIRYAIKFVLENN